MFSSHTLDYTLVVVNPMVSVAGSELDPEPEPVEQQLFAGAGAKVLLTRLRSWVCKFI
jgi:hypothetical protein